MNFIFPDYPFFYHAYQGVDASVKSSPRVYIVYGTHNDFPPNLYGSPLNADMTKNILTLDGGNGIVYVEVDVDSSGNVTSAEINSSDSNTPPANVVNSDGSGTGYQTLFAFYVTYDSNGNAIVTISSNVSGSQACQICLGYFLFGLV